MPVYQGCPGKDAVKRVSLSSEILVHRSRSFFSPSLRLIDSHAAFRRPFKIYLLKQPSASTFVDWHIFVLHSRSVASTGHDTELNNVTVPNRNQSMTRTHQEMR